MNTLTIVQEEKRYTVYHEATPVGHIAFEYKNPNATLAVGDMQYRVEQENHHSADKVLKQDGETLFRFKFDKIWGGSTVRDSNGDIGLSIKGKWFKPGTRLVDNDKNDLVVVVSDQKLKPTITATIIDETISPVIIMATIYHHIYASAIKTMGVAYMAGM